MARNYAECPCNGCPRENDCFYQFDHCMEDCEEWYEWYYGKPKIKSCCSNCHNFVNEKCKEEYLPDLDMECYNFEPNNL